jgi:phosphate starvation-inducible protein PhoH
VLTDPLTDYLRWQLDVITEPAVEAGEDIRVLPAATAATLDLGRSDFYLLDDRQAVVLDFDNGQVTGAQLLDEPADLAPFRAIRARAWDHALRLGEYRRVRA